MNLGILGGLLPALMGDSKDKSGGLASGLLGSIGPGALLAPWMQGGKPDQSSMLSALGLGPMGFLQLLQKPSPYSLLGMLQGVSFPKQENK